MTIAWGHAWPTITAAFLASAVEFVEALTIVLAVGTVRGWRLVERQLSAVETSTELPAAVKALQLWR